MSVKLMSIAWEADLKSTKKLVLLALADAASDEGVCWPSWETIMRKAGISKGALSNALKGLEALGLIKRFSRKRENGSTASNGYIVLENITENDIRSISENRQSSESEHRAKFRI